MSKRKIYLVECKQIRRKKIAVIVDDENDAANLTDDLLNYGKINFDWCSRYGEDFKVEGEITAAEAEQYRQYKYEDII